jgi:methionyl aminopeptidase
VLHGLPHDYALRDGDILSMDLAVAIDGWVADSARTVIVGTPPTTDLRLIRATEEALAAGIAAARPATGSATSRGDRGGRHRLRLPDQHASSAATARPNDARGSPRSQQGRAGRGLKLRAGHDPGTRTLVRPHHRPDRLRPRRLDHPLADGSRTAHSEHTVAITENGPWCSTNSCHTTRLSAICPR